MSFRQHTHTHSLGDSFAIGKGQLTGGNMYAAQPPTTGGETLQRTQSKPTLSQKLSMEQDQHTEDVLGGNATPYGW